jgi:hypothetical protein
LYTAEFVEEWINRSDSVSVNAMAALQACAATGYHAAVKMMTKRRRDEKSG